MSSTHFVRHAGFSIVELVVAIVLIGILSAVLLINSSAQAQHSVTTQADELRRNLSHLQLLTISQGVRLKLLVTSTNYSVCTALTTTCISTSAITDPATGLRFSVDTTDGVTFTLGVGNYYFDSFGRPVVAATGNTLKTNQSTFTLSDTTLSRSVNVVVFPITGFAQTRY